MNIEVADTKVATRVATTTTRKIAGSKAEPDPVPMRTAEDMKRLLRTTSKGIYS
jgi:hypothetical protein